MTPLKTFASVTAAVALAFSLAACSPDSDEPATTPTETAAPTQQPADVEPTPSEPDSDANAGDSAAIEAYAELVAEASAGMIEAFGDVYSDFEIVPIGTDTLEYRYTYADHVDPAVAEPALEEQVEFLQGMADLGLFDEMESAGVVDPKVRYTYLNADGSLIYTVTLERS